MKKVLLTSRKIRLEYVLTKIIKHYNLKVNIMPNTSSAKKALRGSLKKKEFNTVKKSKIKTALKEFRKVLSTNPSAFKETLAKAFSALDKAVKTNIIPKGRADRKKARLAAMATKANNETEKKVVRTKVKKTAEPKVAKAKAVAKPKVATKAVAKPAEKKEVAEKAPKAKAVAKKPAVKKAVAKK